MRYVWDSAFALLIVTGGLLGLTLPFGKLATEAGIPAIAWAFLISFGAGGVLFCALLLGGGRVRLTAHKLRYFAVAAAVSYAVPNLLMFSAIPHLGAGYTGIMFTLSPVLLRYLPVRMLSTKFLTFVTAPCRNVSSFSVPFHGLSPVMRTSPL